MDVSRFLVLRWHFDIISLPIVVKHMIQFSDSFKFDILFWYYLGMNNFVVEKVNFLFECFII